MSAEPASQTDHQHTDQQRSLAALVRSSPLPLFAVHLPDCHFIEVSDSMLALTKRVRSDVLGTQLLEGVSDPEAVHQSLALLASGKLDGYTRRGDLRLPGGEMLPLTIRVTALTDECPRTMALGMILDSEPEVADPALQDLPDGVEEFALGTVDHEWRIDRITSDIAGLLTSDASALLGQSVFMSVHPEDIAQLLLLASQASARQAAATGRVRLRDSQGSWVQCRVAVLPLAGAEPGGFAFALSRVATTPTLSQTTSRTRELEEHLRRIAREVSASGVAALGTSMPTALDIPELGTLTSREYEIVVRLVGGERVSLIARRLFLSESTVRNHLTSVYRKLGVTSQPELLTKLQKHAGVEAGGRVAAPSQ